MSLIVETGTGDPTAESLISIVEARAYAVAHGLTLPESDTAVEVLCRLASEWLGGMEHRLQGYRRVTGQALAFPRIGVSLASRGDYRFSGAYLDYLPETVISVDLKKALCQLVYEMTLIDANPTATGQVILQETVGPLSTTYANTGVVAITPVFPKVMAFLFPFFKAASGITVVRA